MRGRGAQFVRMFLVVALGAGLGALAAMAARPEKPRAAQIEKPAPIILATVMESTLPDHCLLPLREPDEKAASGEKTRDRDNAQRSKKKVIACG